MRPSSGRRLCQCSTWVLVRLGSQIIWQLAEAGCGDGRRVSEVVTSLADPSANVIFGAVIDEAYEGNALFHLYADAQLAITC